MADQIEFSMKEYTDIQKEYPYWNMFPLVDLLYKKGREPLILIGKATLDTLDSSFAEICDPTNDVLNFSSPQQVYFRSSDAGDTEKEVKVIGQKSDGSFGVFTFTTDGTDGTTPVDEGTWNVIFATIPIDTFAGNAIIDDDGSSTTVFFTLALGADDYTGIVHVPDGYYAQVISMNVVQTDVPTTVASDAVLFKVGDCNSNIFPYGQKADHVGDCPVEEIYDEQDQIKIQGRYDTAIIPSELHFAIVFWEKPSNA